MGKSRNLAELRVQLPPSLPSLTTRNPWKALALPYRLVPMASNSSMKMIDGAFSLAKAKASRTSLAPSPMNICTS